jgi:hypothetical protein
MKVNSICRNLGARLIVLVLKVAKKHAGWYLPAVRREPHGQKCLLTLFHKKKCNITLLA